MSYLPIRKVFDKVRQGLGGLKKCDCKPDNCKKFFSGRQISKHRAKAKHEELIMRLGFEKNPLDQAAAFPRVEIEDSRIVVEDAAQAQEYVCPEIIEDDEDCHEEEEDFEEEIPQESGCYSERGLLNLSGNTPYFPLCIMLNCDGFCPFKYRTHSSWAFIISICNLPRCLRNKQEFTVLWSVVEPPATAYC